MKYGASPTTIPELLVFTLGKMPVPMFDCLYAIMKTRSLMAAVKLGVFEALRDGPLSAAQTARNCGLDEECTESLLRLLAATEYVTHRSGRFSLSRLSRKMLIAGSESELFGFVLWNYAQWDMVAKMEDLLKTGQGIDFHQTLDDPDAWANYQRGMMEIARHSAPIVASRVPVRRGARRLLDIAGSHGLFGATVCRKHPPMRSIVLDLPAALGHARKLASEAGIDDVVEHREGDILSSDYGRENDVVLLSNILHHFKADVNVDILRRALASLVENGTAAIWEIEAPEPNSKPGVGDGAALFFRLTSNARNYHGSEYSEWMRRAGFVDVKVLRPVLTPGSVLIIGRKR